MSKINPSQYDCDIMEPGDVIFVKNRSYFYKLYRKLFNPDKIKIRVKKFISDNCDEYVTYYQEDCVLIYNFETKCVQNYDNRVPYVVYSSKDNKLLSSGIIKNLTVGLDNCSMQINNYIIKFPHNLIHTGIETNMKVFKSLEDTRVVQQQIKFLKYKGETFYKIYKDKNLTEWNVSYCNICGNPITFEFKEDGVIISNNCSCGNTTINMNKLTWDELALWYASQVNPFVKKLNDKFWFGEG